MARGGWKDMMAYGDVLSKPIGWLWGKGKSALTWGAAGATGVVANEMIGNPVGDAAAPLVDRGRQWFSNMEGRGDANYRYTQGFSGGFNLHQIFSGIMTAIAAIVLKFSPNNAWAKQAFETWSKAGSTRVDADGKIIEGGKPLEEAQPGLAQTALASSIVAGTAVAPLVINKVLAKNSAGGDNDKMPNGGDNTPTKGGGNGPVVETSSIKTDTTTRNFSADEIKKMQGAAEKLGNPVAGLTDDTMKAVKASTAAVTDISLTGTANSRFGQTFAQNFLKNLDEFAPHKSGMSIKGNAALQLGVMAGIGGLTYLATGDTAEAADAAINTVPYVDVSKDINAGEYAAAAEKGFETTLSLAGGLSGAWAGAAAGGAAGTAVPLIGNVIGAAVGGVGGAVIGSGLAGYGADKAWDAGEYVAGAVWDNGGEQFWKVNKTLFNTASDYAGNKLTEWFGAEAADSEANRQKSHAINFGGDKEALAAKYTPNNDRYAKLDLTAGGW